MLKLKCCCIAALIAIGIASMPIRTMADGVDVPEVFPTEASGINSDSSADEGLQTVELLKAPKTNAPANNAADDGTPRGPGSDSCGSATPAANGGNAFDTTTATPDGPTSHTGCQYTGSENNNVWFSYQATCTGQLTATTCEQLGGSADYDTRIAIYSGTCGSLVTLDCNDDDLNNTCGADPIYHSTAQALVTSGQTYLISVGGFSTADNGSGSLFIACNGDVSGACCTLGACTDEVDEAACDAIDGTFQGIGTECATTDCPCGDAGYFNQFAGGGGFVTIPQNFSLGNGIQLAGTDRAICQVQFLTRNIAAPVGTAYRVRLNIYDACPSSQSPPVTACGSTANLLYTALNDVSDALVSVAAGGATSVATWTLPDFPVRDNIWIMFEAPNASTHAFVDDTGPLVGARTTAAALCYSGNSGCGWQFGTGLVNFTFSVFTRPITGPGACCDFATGTCTNVVGQTNCDGANETFTFSGFGGDCSNPTQGFTCVALLGACCNLTTDVCTDGVLPTNCAAADQKFSLGQTCATVVCPLTCTPGGDGQIADYGAHGGSLGRTADLSPEFAGFRVADNFSPDTNSPLTSVRWWGVYRNFFAGNVPCTPSQGDVPDNFTITIWNDALGIPFQIVPGGGPISVTPTKVSTGFDINAVGGPRRVYQYTVTGLNIAMQQDLCYWVEIVNDTTGGDCQWVWLAGPEGDLKAVQHTGVVVPPWDQADIIPHDMAFCLSFPLADDACDTAIELPGACCLGDSPFCSSLTPTDCATLGGTFTLTGAACPSPVNSTPLCKGACCIGNACQILIQSECNNASGFFFGVGTDCDPNPCAGACCLSDGSCIDTAINQLTCETALPSGNSGSWNGGATCATVTCSTFDQCNATVLACNSSTAFNNRAQATDEGDGVGDAYPDNPDPSCYGGNGQGDGEGNFWVAFTGTGQSVEVSTCDSEVSDTALAVYTYGEGQGCPTLLTLADEVACSEDDATCSDGLQSKVCLATTVLGKTYYVQVSSFAAADVGNFTVNITCPCPVACACPGDTSGDGALDGEDVQSFANCLVNGGAGCDCADSDGDGLADDEFGATGDIADFVNKLLTGAVCPP